MDRPVAARSARPAAAGGAGDCVLRLSVYQSTVSATDYLSVCLESKDTEKAGPSERTCWCLFRLAVASQAEAGRQVRRPWGQGWGWGWEGCKAGAARWHRN